MKKLIGAAAFALSLSISSLVHAGIISVPSLAVGGSVNFAKGPDNLAEYGAVMTNPDGRV